MGRGCGKTPQKVVDLITSEVKRTSQSATARATGLTLLSVQNYLNGISEPTPETLQRIAKYFKVTFVIEIGPDGVEYR